MSDDAIAVDALLELKPGTDPRAPGGEVTVALCGHWEHAGPCHWPHNSRIDSDAAPARLRTVVVVPAADRAEVERRVEVALRGDDRWTVIGFAVETVTDDERGLAHRLAQPSDT